jgi:hypothetical protein
MIEGGHITAEEIEDDLRRLDDNDPLILTPTLWSVWGRRPPTARSLNEAAGFVGAGI